MENFEKETEKELNKMLKELYKLNPSVNQYWDMLEFIKTRLAKTSYKDFIEIAQKGINK